MARRRPWAALGALGARKRPAVQLGVPAEKASAARFQAQEGGAETLPLRKQLVIGQVRPALEAWLEEHGLAWADALPSLQKCKTVEEVERAARNPQPIVEELKKAGGELSVKIHAAEYRRRAAVQRGPRDDVLERLRPDGSVEEARLPVSVQTGHPMHILVMGERADFVGKQASRPIEITGPLADAQLDEELAVAVSDPPAPRKPPPTQAKAHVGRATESDVHLTTQVATGARLRRFRRFGYLLACLLPLAAFTYAAAEFALGGSECPPTSLSLPLALCLPHW